MKSVNSNSSTDRRKEKQTLINSLWESLFGGDIKDPPSKKVDFNPNRRLYMVGLEDFSLDSSDNKFGNVVKQRKIGDENASRKEGAKTLPDSGRKFSERPKSKDAERKHKLRNEKNNNKEGEKKLKKILPKDLISITDKDKQLLNKEKQLIHKGFIPITDKDKELLNKEKQLIPKGFIPITDKDKKLLNKDKTRNRTREVKIKDELRGRDLQQHSKVSFNLNHLPEDAKERSEIIAHVIERVDTLKKRMQDEKQKLDEKCKEQKKRSRSMRSSSVGKTGESLSVKTIYWPKNEGNTCEDPVLRHFSAVTGVSNNYSDPKLEKLEKLSLTLKENIDDVNKNLVNHCMKDEGNVGKLENIRLDQSKNIEECKIENEVSPNRKLENAEMPAQIDLKQNNTYKINPHSASDMSMQPALAANKLMNPKSQLDSSNEIMITSVMPDIECDDGDNKKESDKINGDGEKKMVEENQTLEIPSKHVNVNELDIGVFNVEMKNDEISTLFIMEGNIDYDEVNMRRKETSNNFLVRDGSGEKGSWEVEKPKSDEDKHNVQTELEQNSTQSYSENPKSRLIQSFMESHETVMNTSPPSNSDSVKNNYEVNTCHEHYYDLLTGENSIILQTNDFYKRDNRVENDNETKIPDNSVVVGIYKIKSYIPASQRKPELKARYVPRLVSLSFCMQMASCYKIVVQFDKSLTCETFPNQENSLLKRRAVQFAQYPKLEYSLSGFSDTNLSDSEELIDDILTEDELECMMCDTLEQNQEILEDIEDKVENSCPGEVQLSNFENNEIISPNTWPTTISNPVYVVIMDANEKNSPLFGKAEVCKIESTVFSELLLNEISGVNKRLVVGSEPRKSDKTDKNSDLERKNKSISNDKFGKQTLVPSQSRDKFKYRASSVCLPSGMSKYHTKRNSNSPRAKFSQSNVVFNRPKANSQVAVSKQSRNVANEEVPSKSREAKNRRSSSLGPPEYLNSQLLSIREEIRELKNLFAER
ncbi:hypothetical protein LSTR_LSTR011731 [Laodelphax striatellus]|uniref:Uncharacterized protein n=1 Tax=Laodelphax striatellus TaxID=195883 RepID=A0A482WLT4_LAOST|nr:hypothetical protein LSTR_LSTR011731 [Laodelphax striatellus]